MSFIKKIWKNKTSEYDNRYRIENVETGSIQNAYLHPNNGVIIQEGDVLDADTLNDLENRIEQGFNAIDVPDANVNIAGTEDGQTASKAYTQGEYLVRNHVLYKAIANISLGGSFAVGTNIAVAKVADELANHLNVGGTEFYFDYQDSKFGYNTNANRGADTFHPFKSGGEILADPLIISAVGGAGACVFNKFPLWVYVQLGYKYIKICGNNPRYNYSPTCKIYDAENNVIKNLGGSGYWSTTYTFYNNTLDDNMYALDFIVTDGGNNVANSTLQLTISTEPIS